MTGTCCGSTCEEGKTLHSALLWPGDRVEREGERESKGRVEKRDG